MARPQIRIHDISTDEIVDREMNDAEYKIFLAQQKQMQIDEVQNQALEDAKLAIATKLGLSLEELKIALS